MVRTGGGLGRCVATARLGEGLVPKPLDSRLLEKVAHSPGLWLGEHPPGLDRFVVH